MRTQPADDVSDFFPPVDVGFNDMELPSFDEFLAARHRHLERRRQTERTFNVLRSR